MQEVEMQEVEMQMTTIIVSPGFGAGWSTWGNEDKRKEIAEYQPIIDFIKGGGDVAELDDKEHPLILQMVQELKLGRFYTGGAYDLELQYVDGPYFIGRI